jgi:uridine phosphorylase
MEKQHHLHLLPGDVGETVLLPGDPARAKFIADQFDEAHLIASNRQYITYTGTYQGVKVSVTSVGVGAPALAIAMEELIKVGAKNFIRIGTGGMLQKWLPIPCLIVGTGAVRGDGTSREYFPLEYPAVADFYMVEALIASAEKRGYQVFPGIIRAHDAFYAESSFAKIDYLARDKPWIESGVLVTENESSLLFTLATVRGCRGGTVIASGGCHQRTNIHATEEEMKEKLTQATLMGLDAAVTLSKMK